jgi:ergothioneine biosynthesis protein EgtB
MMVQSCPEASPVKWHLAHTSWFFETFVLAEFLANYEPFHPDFRWLFNSYYKALGEMPEKKLRSSFSRPPLEQILAYREHVDARLCRLLEQTPEDEVLRRVVLGLEHEQQHLELAATDIKHAFFTNPLHPAYQAAAQDESQEKIAPPLEWLSFSPGYPARPGVVEVGVTPQPTAIDSFAFDNETPRHSVYIAPFRLASRPVACAEYLAFIEEDGYARPELWLSEGWDAVQANVWQAPLYWRRDTATQSGWSVFTLHGWRPLGELSETPVCHLSYFEADAFARWSGQRLPTEFEWEFVAAQRSVAGNFLDSGRLHPQPGSPTAPTPQQLFGDVWEWTASPYTGYPGYKPLPGALGEYNGKFMSSQMVLRGGSCVTPASHIRATYRNFFHPATRWQFSGLRLARDGAS